MKSLHSKLEDLVRHGSPGRKSLEVPVHQHAAIVQHVTKDDTNLSVNIAVPLTNNKGSNNVVAPWEDEEGLPNNKGTNNVVAPWEDEESLPNKASSNVVAPWEDDNETPGKVSNVVAPWEDED